MDGETAVTATRWIPRGCCRAEPEPALMQEGDLRGLLAEMQDMKISHDDEDEMAEEVSSDQASARNTEGHDGNATEGDLTTEDVSMAGERMQSINEPDDTEAESSDDEEHIMAGQVPGFQFFSALETDLSAALNDPFIDKDAVGSDEEDEEEALRIRSTDCPLIACSTNAELPTLEVYIYDHKTGAFFIHHDINLGAPPLCVEWLEKIAPSYSGSDAGSYAAVGSFGHAMIEIWNLDVLDQMEPTLVLGRPTKARKKKKGPKQGVPGHSGPVLSLHKNPFRPTILASGSADETVKIWDLMTPVCVETISHHSDKVQVVRWHPVEESIIVTASYDKTLSLVDVRSPQNSLKAGLTSDAEAITWDRHHPANCWVSSDDGKIAIFDFRKLSGDVSQSKTLYALEAHEQACTGIADCDVPGLIVTSSLAGNAKVWNSNDISSGAPAFVFERNLKAGPLFGVTNNSDESTVFSFGGGTVVVWDVGDSNSVNAAFGMPLVEIPRAKQGRQQSKQPRRPTAMKPKSGLRSQ